MPRKLLPGLLVLASAVALALPGAAGAQILDIPDPRDLLPDLNPVDNIFGWINDQINDLYQKLVEFFERLVINPPRPEDGSWQDQLFGNSLGLAGFLATVIAILVTWVALLTRRFIRNAGHAVIVFLLVSFLGASWFALCRWAVTIGDDLANAAGALYEPEGNNSTNILLALPDFTNVMGSIMGLGVVAFFGLLLVMLVFGYELIIILVQFLGLIVFALSPTGERSQKMLSWVFSLGIVSMLFGRAAAVLCLELGQLGIDKGPLGGTGFGAMMYIVASIILALILNGVLIYATHRTYTNATVAGRVGADVRGKVDSRQRDQQRQWRDGTAAHVAGFMASGLVSRRQNQAPEPDGTAQRAMRARTRQMAEPQPLPKPGAAAKQRVQTAATAYVAAQSGNPAGAAAALKKSSRSSKHRKPKGG